MSLQRFCQTIALMTSPDNPDSLCRPGTTWYYTCNVAFYIILTLMSITGFYFLTLRFGLGSSYVIFSNNHNMATGCQLNGDCNRLMCYNNGAGFYLGCFISGLIFHIILIIIGILVWVFIVGVIPFCQTLKSETTNSFDSARDIANKNISIDINNNDGDIVIQL